MNLLPFKPRPGLVLVTVIFVSGLYVLLLQKRIKKLAMPLVKDPDTNLQIAWRGPAGYSSPMII